VNIEPVQRLDGAVEQAVYYCCAEALQNAAKHAGDRARIELTLRVHGQELVFSVSDDGPGLGQDPAAGGHGLFNMRRRMARCR
jgi:signal transduction histidine kinase